MMKLKKFIAKTIREHLNEQDVVNNGVIAYHGTNSVIPFQSFDSHMIGTGLVSSGNKYDGFFFTTEKENAEYYTEYFLCKVLIKNVKQNPINTTQPSTVLKKALEDRTNYIIADVLDGAIISDIIVVPKNNTNTVDIIEWEFVGDEDFLFEKYDEIFGYTDESEDDEDNYDDDGNFMVRRTAAGLIDDAIESMDLDINSLLKIPVFKKYYNTKR